MDTFSGHKIFILVSTIMTWAMSKPANKVGMRKLNYQVGYFIEQHVNMIKRLY